MVGHLFIAIHNPLLRPTMHHSFLVVAHQAAYIQLPYFMLVPGKHGLRDFTRHGIGSVLYLREMALEAREILLYGLIGWFVGPINPLEVLCQKHHVIHADQGSRVVRLFPLAVDFLVAFFATGRVEHPNQFGHRRSLSGGLPTGKGGHEERQNGYQETN